MAVHAELVPPHIDGFAVQTNFRVSRFSAVGSPEAAAARPAQHSRAELELTLVLQGRAQVLVGEQRVLLEAQDLLWIRPRENRVIIDASADFRAWMLVFRPRLVRRVCTTSASARLRGSGGAGVLQRRLVATEVRALSALFASLPAGEGRDVFNAGLGYALTRAWLGFTRSPADAHASLPAGVHPAARRAAWLLREGHAGLSNAELAARVGLSAHRLSRVFKRQMGTSLVEFRNRQRLEMFVLRLCDGEDRNLLALALDSGFGSYTQFLRVFRRGLGCSPAEYLRRRRVAFRPPTRS